MTEAVAVAVVTGLFSVIGSLIVNHYNNGKIRALIEYRLDILEEKQDKYNGVIARQYEAEKNIEALKIRESVSEHRIDDLEKKE